MISVPPTRSIEKARVAPTGLDLQRALALCLLVFAFSFLTYSRTLPPNADEMMNYALAESFAKLGRLDVDQVSTVGANPEEYGLGGHRYSKYGPVQALLAAPLYWLAQRLPVGAVDTVLLENHALTALTVGLLYLLTRRLGYRAGTALLVSLTFFFTTPAWVHAKRFFGEPTTTLFLLLTVYFAVAGRQSGRRRDLVLAGLAAGGLVAAKYVNVVFVAPVLLYAAWPISPSVLTLTRESDSADAPSFLPDPTPTPKWGRGGVAIGSLLARLTWLGVGGAPVAAALGLYNWARFGNPLESGYARWEQFNTPLWEGVGGFLFSPGKSVFVYAPVLLLLFFWGPAFWRRARGLTATLLVVFALHLGVYGTWWVWWGAWAWGPRFLVPLMPLAVLLLAAGLERALDRRSVLGLAAGGLLAALGLAVQVLGVAVDHTVYMAHLLPLNPRPDTLTLYDLSRSPVLAQLQFLTRRWLDFAWVLRDGPAVLDGAPLLASIVALAAGLLGALALWRLRPGWASAFVGLATAAVICAAVLFTLSHYYRADDPTMRGLTARLAAQPAAVVHLAPDHVVPYLNGQKAPLRTVGWSEEPEPLNPRLTTLLEPLVASSREVWLVSQYARGAPPNGVEAWLGRHAHKVEEVPAGKLRLARYRVGDAPAGPGYTPVAARFAAGVELVGYEVLPGSGQPDGLLQVTLYWRTTELLAQDYTVFAHLVDGAGKLQAQQDGPPGDGYRPTSSWRPGELVADHHLIALPASASVEASTLHVGLYLLSTGERLPRESEDGKPDDKVVLALPKAGPEAAR